MRYLLQTGWLAFCLGGCGGGEVVALRFVHPDGSQSEPNTSGYYVCRSAQDGHSYACQSGQALHQFNRVLDAGATCQYGIASVHVETDGDGKVTRIQYACATPPLGAFPPDTAAEAKPAPPAAPAVVPASTPPGTGTP